MSGHETYSLTNVETGQVFYSTHATPSEILNANSNLKAAGQAVRFYAAGTYTMPSLHGDTH